MTFSRNDLPLFQRPKQAVFHKKRECKCSIYQPPPNQSDEYIEVRRRFGTALTQFDSLTARILLEKELMEAHDHLPETFEELSKSFRCHQVLGRTFSESAKF